jgi:UDP-N-acetylmuramoyl-L-alanyl-D-glutamate--2,6-diaminopimelate ligase
MICVLGAAGGGRDKWKRPEMGKIAAELCDKVILTNEDPYDESPQSIIEDIESGLSQFKSLKFKDVDYKKIIDRREAIREALKSAKAGDTVIITGKGAEPWIMGPNNSKIPWDDRETAREELKKMI